MKVLITTDTIGGVWTFSLELARGLLDYDMEVHLACMGRLLSDDQHAQVNSIQNLTVYESDFKLEWMHDPWEDIERSGDWLMDLQEQIQPDVVHLNTYAQGNLNWSAPVIVVAHSDVLTWWKSVKGISAPSEWDLYFRNVKAGMQAAKMVIGVSQHYLDQIRELYGPFNEEEVIYNGLNEEDFSPGEKKALIMGMGRIWDEGKNLNMLASQRKMLKWPLKIAGSQVHPGQSQEINADREIFLGQLDPDSLKKKLSEASVFVLPSTYEPFGLSALEAAFSGCALVLNDLPTLREIWGEAALYFHDQESLLTVIHFLTEDQNALADYQNKARARAKHYQRKKMASAYFGIYNKLVKSPVLLN